MNAALMATYIVNQQVRAAYSYALALQYCGCKCDSETCRMKRVHDQIIAARESKAARVAAGIEVDGWPDDEVTNVNPLKESDWLGGEVVVR